MSYPTYDCLAAPGSGRANGDGPRRATTPVRRPAAAPTVLSRPPVGIATAGLLTDQLRAFLRGHGIGHWEVFFPQGVELGDVERHLEAIGEAGARWEPHDRVTLGGEQPTGLMRDSADEDTENKAAFYPAGFLWLRSHELVVARWHYYDPSDREWWPMYLCAAPSP